MKLRLLSGGAAQGLVAAQAAAFTAETGMEIDGTFGAVGAMKARLLDGEQADAVILTRAVIDELAASGHVDAASIADLGAVRTAVAVRAGDPPPAIGTADELRDTLRAADAIYFPDPQLATAGIHFAKVLGELGIADELGPRLRPFPNGAAAMRELAASKEPRPIGCTQITEILATPGITPVGNLPKQFELATVYSIGIMKNTADPEAARKLAVLLTAPGARQIRERAGFDG